MQLDLASLKSVRVFAENFLRSEPRLDLLINNAGKTSCHVLPAVVVVIKKKFFYDLITRGFNRQKEIRLHFIGPILGNHNHAVLKYYKTIQ